MKRPFSLGTFAASVSLLLSVGCAAILGIEERTEETAEVVEGVEDEQTGLRTTALCVEYCDDVMGNCTDENAQYAARESCINTCNALPEGAPGEPLGNNVRCRLNRAKGAASLPDEECEAAGPGGGDVCGSNCDAWCHLLESECPDDFVALDDCQRACGTLNDDVKFSVDTSYSRDDVACRIIHLGAVAQADVHCTHARYVPAEICSAPQSGEPSCEDTCDVIMQNCVDDDAVYESLDDCLAACPALPLGDLADRVENTVGCRFYHGTSSGLDPATHCDHAGPTGDGHCGEENTAEETGPCNSYCMLYEAGCPTEFGAEFPAAEDCPATCASELDGAGIDDSYDVAVARDADTLQCRVYYLVKALAGDATACENATIAANCQ